MKYFKAEHCERECEIKLNGTVQDVFPLFTPLEEKKWAKNWDPVVIYPHSNKIEKGTVFRSYHHEEGYAYWVIADYDKKNYKIRYVNFLPNKRNGILEIECHSSDIQTSIAKIKYIFTGLTEEGNKFIKSFDKKYFLNYIGEWRNAINKYLIAK